MTAELPKKIHRQPLGAPVVPHPVDVERLERGMAVFEGLHAYISSGARSRSAK